MPPDGKSLTVAAAAARLSLSAHSVLALIAAGRLIASNVSLGSKRPRWRIEVAELSRFLAERQNTPTVRLARRRRTVELVEYV
jgi:hypothetical protein